MTETKPKTCEECGKTDIKNMGAHKRYCKPKTESAMKPEEPKKTLPAISTSNPVEPILSITDITPCDYNTVAWYNTPDGQQSKQISSIGILHKENGENIPCALVMSPGGMLIPAFMIGGFIGMHDDGMCIPLTDDEEPFPPFPEETDEHEKVMIHGCNEDDIKTIEQPKRSLLNKMFCRKPKQDKVNTDTKDLITEAINAPGRTN